MKPSTQVTFDQQYRSHLQHLKLKGLQPKTIDAYQRPEAECCGCLKFRHQALKTAHFALTVSPWAATRREILLLARRIVCIRQFPEKLFAGSVLTHTPRTGFVQQTDQIVASTIYPYSFGVTFESASVVE